MKHSILILLLAASAAVAGAQTASTPASTTATAAKPASKTATATAAVAKPATTAAKPAASAIKLPPGVPPVKGVIKPASFTLRYEDIKIGAGPEAEQNKMYKVNYTLYLGCNGLDSDGHKVDSSYDHPGQPLKDKDGKPVLGDDGKQKMGDPQPMSFPQGMGRLIPGFDQGFEGMKVGGQRRLFIPWQLAYGAKGHPGPDAAHPGIPPKADLIFDVELVSMEEMPAQPNRQGMPAPSGAHPGMPPPGTPGTPPAPKPAGTAPAATPPVPGAAPTAAAPKTSATPATPATPAAAATPATPATSTTPATPATPAAPATPATQPK